MKNCPSSLRSAFAFRSQANQPSVSAEARTCNVAGGIISSYEQLLNEMSMEEFLGGRMGKCYDAGTVPFTPDPESDPPYTPSYRPPFPSGSFFVKLEVSIPIICLQDHRSPSKSRSADSALVTTELEAASKSASKSPLSCGCSELEIIKPFGSESDFMTIT